MNSDFTKTGVNSFSSSFLGRMVEAFLDFFGDFSGPQSSAAFGLRLRPGAGEGGVSTAVVAVAMLLTPASLWTFA